MKSLKERSKRGTLRFSLGLASLIILIPSLVTDYFNLHSILHYTDPKTYLLVKLLIWFILPAICFFIIFSISRGIGYWLSLVLKFLLLANIYFYLSGSVWLGLVVGLFLVFVISYLREVLEKAFFLPVFASLIFLVVVMFKGFGGISPKKMIPTEPRLNAQQQNDATFFQNIKDQGSSQSIYIIVFDELTRNVLFSRGQISESFPSFKKLALKSLYPPRSTTNYDETFLSVETMLSGRLVKPNNVLYNLFRTPTFFDAFHPENIRVWGGLAPYCRSLQAKGMDTVYCCDMSTMAGNWRIIRAMKFDLIRLVHISLLDLPITLILKALEYFKTEKLDIDPGYRQTLIDYLRISLMAKYGSVFLDWIPNDLKMLDDFLENIGSIPNSLYYFHAFLPHSPYLADRELNVRSEIKDICFFWTSSPEEVERVNQNYLKNVQAADTVLGLILERITKKDPQSIVIVTADHGVARDPDLPMRRPTGHYIDDVVDIPFFISLPEGHPLLSTKLSSYQHIDFLPTVLHAMGYDSDNRFEGISAFKPEESSFFFSSKGLTFNKIKLENGNSP